MGCKPAPSLELEVDERLYFAAFDLDDQVDQGDDQECFSQERQPGDPYGTGSLPPVG